MSKKISDLGEFGLISELKQLLPAAPAEWVSIGDDCAVIPTDSPAGNRYQVVTTDSLVERVHFRRETTSAYSVGWKLLAVSLSDICAMGAKAQGAVVAAHLPPTLEVEWIQEVYRGLSDLAKREGIFVLGGDTVRSTELSFCLTAWGFVEGVAILRSGAQLGDDLWLTGELGASSLGLQLLENKLDRSKLKDRGERVIEIHSRPKPRSDVVPLIKKSVKIHSMIDISDGLIQDATHLATSSGVDILLEVEAIPIAQEYFQFSVSPFRALVGGEDYELLFTAPPEGRPELERTGIAKRIGAVRPGSGNVIVEAPNSQSLDATQWLNRLGICSSGYSHF